MEPYTTVYFVSENTLKGKHYAFSSETAALAFIYEKLKDDEDIQDQYLDEYRDELLSGDNSVPNYHDWLLEAFDEGTYWHFSVNECKVWNTYDVWSGAVTRDE